MSHQMWMHAYNRNSEEYYNCPWYLYSSEEEWSNDELQIMINGMIILHVVLSHR